METLWKTCYRGNGVRVYDFTAKSGKYYTKQVEEYAGVSICRYPSYGYYERYVIDANKGSRIRTVYGRG